MPNLPDLRQRRTAHAVGRLHDRLIRLQAYPPYRSTLTAIRRALRDFATRADVRRFRDQLHSSGIAGTDICYRFYWPTARWLAERWPGQLHIDWEEFEQAERLPDVLALLLPYTESLLLDNADLTPRQFLDALKSPRETDATFLVRVFGSASVKDSWREEVYESLDIPMILAPGRDTPTRTLARYRPSPVSFQRTPVDTSRPDMLGEVARPPQRVKSLTRREGAVLIDTAREAMVTRERDLDAFVNADPRDVRMIDDQPGLQFAMIGQRPDRRLVMESVYGFLILKNGIPLGYILSGSLFTSSEVALNVFDTFRGGETARVYARGLATLATMFGSDSFMVPPYQMGHGNPEGLESGAWWFYYKLGFRPEDSRVKRLVRTELDRLRRRPSYRSSVKTLDELASQPMFWYPGGRRADVLGRLDLGAVGEKVSRYLGRRFGAERARGVATCMEEARELLAPGSRRRLTASERLAWERWSPIVRTIPGIPGWPRADRRAFAEVIRAKGGRRESEFVRLFDAHPRLRRAIVRLAAGTTSR